VHTSSEYVVAEIPPTTAPSLFPTAAPSPSLLPTSAPTTYKGFEYKDDFIIVLVAAIGVGSVLMIMCLYHVAVKRLWAGVHDRKDETNFWSPANMRPKPVHVHAPGYSQKYLRGGGDITSENGANPTGRDRTKSNYAGSSESNKQPPDVAGV
jgi:hypothetical protein